MILLEFKGRFAVLWTLSSDWLWYYLLQAQASQQSDVDVFLRGFFWHSQHHKAFRLDIISAIQCKCHTLLETYSHSLARTLCKAKKLTTWRTIKEKCWQQMNLFLIFFLSPQLLPTSQSRWWTVWKMCTMIAWGNKQTSGQINNEIANAPLEKEVPSVILFDWFSSNVPYFKYFQKLQTTDLWAGWEQHIASFYYLQSQQRANLSAQISRT